MTPRIASSAPPTLVRLDAGDAAALHRQIYESLRGAIVDGRLLPGARVPATRGLATELGVSRNTVATALDQLRAEGYVEARPRSGTFVAATLPDATLRARSARAPGSTRRPVAKPPSLAPAGARIAALRVGPAERPSIPRAFRTGLPALDAFPWSLWGRLTSRRLRGSMASLGYYGNAAGYQPLRAAIAEFVAAARGASCDAAQVVVTSGAQQGLDLAARLLLAPGDAAWVEDPGYLGARAAFAAAGARVVPVPVDAEGLSVVEGIRRAPDARLVYVTPSHQYPTGAVMSASRRMEVLRWASTAGAWVLEDDYDSEYRYASRPLACLQGLDVDDRVLYVGTFSKTMFPSLRLGFLVVPPALVDAFTAARAVADRHSAGVEQAVLAQFIADGHFARHVRRMRVLYEERRDALVAAAANVDGLTIEHADAGMHVVGWLAPGMDDVALSAAAAAAGVEAPAISAYAAEPLPRRGLVLGYSGFAPRALRSAMKVLGRVVASTFAP